jgi:hypothetical protein
LCDHKKIQVSQCLVSSYYFEHSCRYINSTAPSGVTKQPHLSRNISCWQCPPFTAIVAIVLINVTYLFVMCFNIINSLNLPDFVPYSFRCRLQ